MEALFAGIATFVFIFLKAFQQRNVAFDKYFAVVPTSIAMAFTEVYVIATIVRVGYDILVVSSIGLGGGLGCLVAMALHRWLFPTPKLVRS